MTNGMDASKMNLEEEDLEKIAAGELEYYKKYTKKYPVTRQEAHRIRMTAKKCKSSGMSYGEYRGHMWGVVKPKIDGDRRVKYADRIFFAGDPDAALGQDLDGMYFNILIDEFWTEYGGVIDPSQN